MIVKNGHAYETTCTVCSLLIRHKRKATVMALGIQHEHRCSTDRLSAALKERRDEKTKMLDA